MLNWLDYRKELTGRIGQFATLSPDTVKGYQTLSKAGAATGHLDAKTRELIALAVSVTTRCDGCITVHTGEALKHGATREEIAEALGMDESGERAIDVQVVRLRRKIEEDPREPRFLHTVRGRGYILKPGF